MREEQAGLIFSSGRPSVCGWLHGNGTAVVRCCDVKYTRVAGRWLTCRTFLHLGFLLPSPINLQPHWQTLSNLYTIAFPVLELHLNGITEHVLLLPDLPHTAVSYCRGYPHSFFLLPCWGVFSCINRPKSVVQFSWWWTFGLFFPFWLLQILSYYEPALFFSLSFLFEYQFSC